MEDQFQVFSFDHHLLNVFHLLNFLLNVSNSHWGLSFAFSSSLGVGRWFYSIENHMNLLRTYIDPLIVSTRWKECWERILTPSSSVPDEKNTMGYVRLALEILFLLVLINCKRHTYSLWVKSSGQLTEKSYIWVLTGNWSVSWIIETCLGKICFTSSLN